MNVVPSRFNPERMDMVFEEISPLESKKGKIANAVLLNLDFHRRYDDFFAKVENITGDERPGELFLNIYDAETRQSIRVRARKKISICRDLMDAIKENGIQYRIETMNTNNS